MSPPAAGRQNKPHQFSSRQVDSRQQEDRVQPRVGLHLPSLLLHLQTRKREPKYEWDHDFKRLSRTKESASYFSDPSNDHISNLTIEPASQWHTNDTVSTTTAKTNCSENKLRLTNLVFRGLTQINLSTLSTSPATEAVSLSSST